MGLLYGQRYVNQSRYFNGMWEERPSIIEKQTRFSALQHVRLGARDGLRVALSTAVSLDKDRWQFAWIEADVQAPIGSRSWLTARGSGSADTGFFFAEVGFRRMVRGNGGPGSLFLRPSAGVAGIAKQGTGSDVALGPLVGLQVETRLEAKR